jgi:hypothetical protein
MKIFLSDTAEFKPLLEALVDELMEAREHFHLHQQLTAAIADNSDAFNFSVSFWHLTFRAHIDAALMRLCKAYDLYESNTLNLRNFLETVQAYPGIFDEPNFRERLKDNPYVDSLARDLEEPTGRLQEDLDFVTRGQTVKKLTIWRNNYIAHKNRNAAVALANFSVQHPLTFAEIDNLIDKGLEIVNHYSRLYQASHYIASQSDDYQYVLKAIRGDLERREADIQNQIEAIRALGGGGEQSVLTMDR